MTDPSRAALFGGLTIDGFSGELEATTPVGAQRRAVCAEALSWIGTNFHHQARLKCRRDASGTIIDRGGVDCAQSVYLIYRAALPDKVPAFRGEVEDALDGEPMRVIGAICLAQIICALISKSADSRLAWTTLE